MSEETIEQTGGWAASPSVAAAAVEAVLAQQEAAWDRGERTPVEDLLAAHPAFADETNAVLELVCNEVVLREERGERPSLAEYQQRFPDLADPLRVQWEVDRALFSRRSRAAASTPADPAATAAHTPARIAKSARDTVAGRTVGRYRVESVLGRGGMGVAYRAWDPDLKRVVAVKMLRAADADESEIARFRTEAEAIARVRHPNIVQVFDVGEDAGQPFFAMEFCAGGSLAGRLKAGPLSPPEAAAVVEQVARGVDAAHRQSVIHRDLKPANILLTIKSEARNSKSEKEDGGSTLSDFEFRASDFIAKVTDFGLAKALDTDDGRTRTGAILGTPCYMSPEQARGDTKDVGTSTDVYALGAILYECLTGRPPFQGATVVDTLEQVRGHEPVPVRQLQPALPRDLETIALKCLQKEIAKRYASASDLVADLGRFREGRPILARPVGPVERARRWCRRNPLVAGLIAGVVVVFVAGLTGTTVMWRQAVAQKNQAEKNYEASEASLRQAFGAVSEYFIQVSDDPVLNEPHMLGLRREMLVRARPYFESFAAQRRGDPAWARELAIALSRLAHVSQLIDPAAPAVTRWQDAVAAWEAVLRANPGDADTRLELAKAYASIGYQQWRAEQWAAAESSYTAALDHLRAVPDREARGYDALSVESQSLAYLSGAAALQGQLPRAAERYADALRAQRRAVERHPTPHARLELGVIHFLRGQTLTRAGDADGGAAELAAAVGVFRAVAALPVREQVPAYRQLAAARGEFGIARRHSQTLPPNKALPEAAQALAESCEIWEGLCRQFPSVSDYQKHMAEAKFQLAAVGADTGQWFDADAVARQALGTREKLLSAQPGHPAWLRDVAESNEQVRVIAQKRLRSVLNSPAADKAAAAVADAAKAELDFLVKHTAHPAVGGEFVGRVLIVSPNRARLLGELGRSADARTEWDRAIRFAPPDRRAAFEKERDAAK